MLDKAPLTKAEIAKLSEEELIKSGRLDTLDNERIRNMSGKMAAKVVSAREKLKDWEANANFELPQNAPTIDFFPDKETVFSNEEKRASFFIFQITSRGGLGTKNAEIKIYIADQKYTTQTIRGMLDVYNGIGNTDLGFQGMGIINKEDSDIKIQWESETKTSEINTVTDPVTKRMLDPHPSKFANWIKEQLKEKIKDILN